MAMDIDGKLEELKEIAKTLHTRYPCIETYDIEEIGLDLLEKTKYIMRVLK